MGENLLDYCLFVDEAYNPHLSSAFRACQRIYFPYLFYALTLNQLRYSLWLIGSDIYNSLITGNSIFVLLIFPLFLLFSISTHPVTIPAEISD